jgi:hypothetical protein
MRKESQWLVIYDPQERSEGDQRSTDSAFRDFAADGKSNRQGCCGCMPNAFINAKAFPHRLMIQPGYVGHFCNHRTADGSEANRVSALAASFRNYEVALWELLDSKQYDPKVSKLPTLSQP